MSITTSGTCRLVGLALVVLAVGGCGSTGEPDQPASPSAGVSPSTGASTGASPSSGLSAPGTPRCATPGLRASISTGEGAAGSTFYRLRLTNTSAQPCRTGGFGGVSLVSRPTGPPIGAPADRVDKGQARPLTLRPGGHAEAVLRVVNAGNFPRAVCRPVAARGLRVYPPNETRSLFVALAATACRSPSEHVLTLSPYASGG